MHARYTPCRVWLFQSTHGTAAAAGGERQSAEVCELCMFTDIACTVWAFQWSHDVCITSCDRTRAATASSLVHETPLRRVLSAKK
jgi:hypothetical protein